MGDYTVMVKKVRSVLGGPKNKAPDLVQITVARNANSQQMVLSQGEFKSLCQHLAALVWKPFNQEDESTWPELYKDVLCFDGKSYFVAQVESTGGFYDGNSRGTLKHATKYMPIPKG